MKVESARMKGGGGIKVESPRMKGGGVYEGRKVQV